MSRNTPKGMDSGYVRCPQMHRCQCRLAGFPQRRPSRPFDAYKFINWRLFWEFSGGNVTENMVHQIAFIIRALIFLCHRRHSCPAASSQRRMAEVPDTIAVTLDFPNDIVVTWQSTFSNSHYGLGERFLGSDGTIERLMGSTDMVTGKSVTGVHYYPEKMNRKEATTLEGQTKDLGHMANFVDCVRSRKEPNAPVEIGYRSAVAAHMANISYRHKERVTLRPPSSWL